MTERTRINCPECASHKVWKDGLRYTMNGDVQRWLCRCCGHRFSGVEQHSVPQLQVEEDVVFQPFEQLDARPDFTQVRIGHSDSTAKKALDDAPFSNCEDVSPHDDPDKSTVGKTIYPFASTTVNAEYAPGKEAKNLVAVEPHKTKLEARQATIADLATIKGMLVKHAWWLEKEGREESTITLRNRLLATLIRRGVNLLDPDSVKMAIARLKCQSGTKLQYVNAYKSFVKANKISWSPPKYTQNEKIPFVPTEAEINQLIAACGKKMGTLLQLLKETAMRVGEALRLKWSDVDMERSMITFNKPEKRSRPRIFKVSHKLIGMLQGLPRESERIFKTRLNVKQNTFMQTRRKAAKALQNPRILRIKFHTFRHWKATMEYHKTKDILHVMKLLGHRNIKNTLIYIDLENVLFSERNDEFHVKVAKTVEEACKLAEVGFEHFTTIDDVQIFRKRK